MHDQANAATTMHGQTGLKTLLTITTVISALGLSLWATIQLNRSLLPSPESETGRTLLDQYQILAHGIWFILLLVAVGYLIQGIYTSERQKTRDSQQAHSRPVASFLRFIRNNPITTALFIAYTVAMISGTTYLYRDMVGWYPDLIQGHFLDNFSIRGSFVDETLRRTDYRFFPLGHQDLHILSWFTIHIKTWMLFSAAELAGIALLSTTFINNLEGRKKSPAAPSTIFLVTSLILFHPSTGIAFFHVTYCERILCLILTLYLTSYQNYRIDQSRSSLYRTYLWALLGIFIKDTAIILFVIPPACLWLSDSISHAKQAHHSIIQSLANDQHRLEQWLCSLSAVFMASYIILALIPSAYAAEGAYTGDVAEKITLDARFWAFTLIAAWRAVLIVKGRLNPQLLDAVNLSGFAYACALAVTYKFESTSYLALPIQIITVFNAGWIWTNLIETRPFKNTAKKKNAMAACFAVLAIGTEHSISKQTFLRSVADTKAEQAYVQQTYERLHQISREIRESGDDVNIIINKDSALSAKRHLSRIPYRSLIEYEPKTGEFKIKDGAHKRALYTPKTGDIIANIDKTIHLIEPIREQVKGTEVLYRHNPSVRTGLILRVTATKP